MEHIETIKAFAKKYKGLKHASNIKTKLEKTGKGALKPDKKNLLVEIAKQYHTYLKSNLELHGYDKETIKKRVTLLNTYFDYIHNGQYDNAFDSRGKFRSTILEEFIYILFKDYVEELQANIPEANRKKIAAGGVKAYLNLFITAKHFTDFAINPSMQVNDKNQDYAIYREVKIKIEGNKEKTINVPCAAIEVKTYIDKTMLDTIIATAEKLKGGNPYTKFIAVSETYAVDQHVDPAYSKIDQIYVLRKSDKHGEWKKIDEDLVYDLFEDIKRHIEAPWSDVPAKLAKGRIL